MCGIGIGIGGEGHIIVQDCVAGSGFFAGECWVSCCFLGEGEAVVSCRAPPYSRLVYSRRPISRFGGFFGFGFGGGT